MTRNSFLVVLIDAASFPGFGRQNLYFEKVSEKIANLLDKSSNTKNSFPEKYALDHAADQYLQLFESLRSNY